MRSTKIARIHSIVSIIGALVLLFSGLKAAFGQSPQRDTVRICADSIELARPDSLDKHDTTAVRYIMRVNGRDTTLLIPKSMRFRIARDLPYTLSVVGGKIVDYKPRCAQPRLQSILQGVVSTTDLSARDALDSHSGPPRT